MGRFQSLQIIMIVGTVTCMGPLPTLADILSQSTVRDSNAQGVSSLNQTNVSSGPVFLADLPAGHYKIVANNQDQTQIHSLNVVPR